MAINARKKSQRQSGDTAGIPGVVGGRAADVIKLRPSVCARSQQQTAQGQGVKVRGELPKREQPRGLGAKERCTRRAQRSKDVGAVRAGGRAARARQNGLMAGGQQARRSTCNVGADAKNGQSVSAR